MLSRDSLETRRVFMVDQASLSLVCTVAFVGTGTNHTVTERRMCCRSKRQQTRSLAAPVPILTVLTYLRSTKLRVSMNTSKDVVTDSSAVLCCEDD